MKKHIIVLGANAAQDLYDAGRFVRILEATGSVRIESSSGIFADLAKGQAILAPEPWGSLRITDLGGIGQTVTVFIGDGQFFDDRLTGTIQTTPAASTTLTTTADASCTTTAGQKVAANASRRAVILAAAPANTDNIKVGDSNVGAARGITLQPGQAITLDTTAAIHARAASGTQTLEIMEI